MFMLPIIPKPHAGTHELADFAELLCWMKGHVSEREIVALLGREGENENNTGCDDEDDDNENDLDEVMNEIELRSVACGNGYPFLLKRKGTVLHFDKTAQNNTRSIIYLYLLLSTRLNMKNNRTHNQIDGTLLLEKLSAYVLKNYLGSTKAKSLVFGTAERGGFRKKVENLCRNLGEGGGFKDQGSVPIQANDDKLDTVAWVPFTDGRAGQLIIFGQCKTGTNWHGSITHLQPSNFIDMWLIDPFLVKPVRAFCVSEAVDGAKWRSICLGGGILFDRCRLVDFCEGIASGVEADIRKWTLAAKKTDLFARGGKGIKKKMRKARKSVGRAKNLRKKS